ncbi:MAG: hypothetical protein EA001_11930 [Oscillatoriales cyanobacterium]|nr:MAG: hypothetical protein EA001_11930 [Oscillatoriales cyanobacterium]
MLGRLSLRVKGRSKLDLESNYQPRLAMLMSHQSRKGLTPEVNSGGDCDDRKTKSATPSCFYALV